MTACFGSQAALRSDYSRTAAIGCKAVVQPLNFGCRILNVCFHPKRSFKLPNYRYFEGLLSAISGHHIPAQSGGKCKTLPGMIATFFINQDV